MCRARVIVGLRALTTTFFVATTIYGLLAASSFAYQQFIKPGLFPWLASAASGYRYLLLGVVSLTVLTLSSERDTRRSRIAVVVYAIAGLGTAATLLAFPGVETGGDPATSLTIAALALVPPLWLAVIDHVASWSVVFGRRDPVSPVEPRLFATAAGACLYVWALYSTIALARAGMDALGPAWLVATAASLATHAAAFIAIAWLLMSISAIARMAADPRPLEYVGALTCFGAWLFALLHDTLLPTLALRGPAVTLVAAGLSLTVAACWSGMALRLAAADADASTGFELFFRPVAPPRAGVTGVARLVLLMFVAAGLIRVTAPIDWGFLLQKLSVLTVWIATWGTVHALTRGTRTPSRRVAIVMSLLIVVGYRAVRLVETRASTGQAGAPQVMASIDRYGTYDASFKVLDDAVSGRAETSTDFYRFLSAHANVDPAVPISPKRLDLGPPLAREGIRRPDIFLFVIDSLRRDYVSAYNPAVTFTPNIDAFAAESLVFRNAFSRYGGTGLAVPSIFSGSLLPHRQYVLPFTPMNALGRVLADEDYRFAMSVDSVVATLAVPPPDAVILRAGHGPTSGDMCDTLADLEHTITTHPAGHPLFAYTLPQNIHVSYVASQPRPDSDYPGFHGPTAAQLRRLDDCFGGFVRFLKSKGRFDDSLIVLTSDHGDALGEDGRWGHGDAGFPEIFRIPLIMHLPSGERDWNVDLSAVSFSTDIAPTIYTVLGGRADPRGRLSGASLLWRDGDTFDRRQEDYLVTSSYGPVYGLLTANGSRLYVVDAINARDYAFELTGNATRRVTVTAAERKLNQQRLAEQVEELSAFFGYDIER